MKFPTVGEIASRDVVLVQRDVSIAYAIEKMVEAEHRNIVVQDTNQFYILTILDVLKLQDTHSVFEDTLEKITLQKIPTIEKSANILDTLEFVNRSIEYVCVTHEDGTLFGLITQTDITSNIDPDTLMENFRLQDFLKLGHRVKWVTKESTTRELLESMVRGSFDNVIVLEEKKPIGILTTKDVMELIKNRNDLSLPVIEYMSSPVDTIDRKASIKEALNFLQEKHYKRVVVVDEMGELTGVITQKELISLTFSRWAMLMKEYQDELCEINHILEIKTKEYEAMASTDALTGLYNRHKFYELYNSTYTTMVQRENEASVVMLDIDYFKQVNDTFGHNVGDKVLIQVAHMLIRTLREVDIVCRWGGEEFILLLPTASLENAAKLAEKLRKNMHTLNIDTVGSISASFGVSQVRKGDDVESVVGRADKALYLAKESGRDCVKTELEHNPTDGEKE